MRCMFSLLLLLERIYLQERFGEKNGEDKS